MQTDREILKNLFNNNGFFVCKNVFDKDFIQKVLEDIEVAKDTIKYFDSQKNLRRVEKLYNKGDSLKKLNEVISLHLKTIFQKDFIIFKDKFNAKPPGGDGFFAHFDGIFNFINENDEKKRGWYEYGNFFINALVALDVCNIDNGTIELSKFHDGNFEDLIKKTKKDGTPALDKQIEKNLHFEPINLNIGDMIVFSNKCPHRSKKNNTNLDRRILYYTYTLSEYGSKYDLYFKDKEKSKNPSKALV
jgi:ectoine hydroxylase-related dioxygenase (phytanoyl-CoA dioxygenase family)